MEFSHSNYLVPILLILVVCVFIGYEVWRRRAGGENASGSQSAGSGENAGRCGNTSANENSGSSENSGGGENAGAERVSPEDLVAWHRADGQKVAGWLLETAAEIRQLEVDMRLGANTTTNTATSTATNTATSTATSTETSTATNTETSTAAGGSSYGYSGNYHKDSIAQADSSVRAAIESHPSLLLRAELRDLLAKAQQARLHYTRGNSQGEAGHGPGKQESSIQNHGSHTASVQEDRAVSAQEDAATFWALGSVWAQRLRQFSVDDPTSLGLLKLQNMRVNIPE